jgi:hypothetical protein
MSIEKMMLFYNGEEIIIFIGHAVPSDMLMRLFNHDDFRTLSEDLTEEIIFYQNQDIFAQNLYTFINFIRQYDKFVNLKGKEVHSAN